MNIEELLPLIADLKKAVDCLIIACEDNRRSIDSMYETLAIQGVNIGLLFKGFLEISESEDGRDNYLSSTLKEMGTHALSPPSPNYIYKSIKEEGDSSNKCEAK